LKKHNEFKKLLCVEISRTHLTGQSTKTVDRSVEIALKNHLTGQSVRSLCFEMGCEEERIALLRTGVFSYDPNSTPGSFELVSRQFALLD
jgi:hypothetical protein